MKTVKVPLNHEGAAMIRYRHVMLLITVALLGFAAIPSAELLPTAAAAEPVADPNSPYQMTGTIDAVDLANNMVLIDDSGYRLSDGVTIHAGRNGVATRSSLRVGAKVGFSIDSVQNGQRVVSEIWLLSGR